MRNLIWTLLLTSIVISGSTSDDVCTDGLSLSCPSADQCQLSVKIGDSTPACQTVVPLSAWSTTPPSLSLTGSNCVVPDGRKVGILMTDPDAPNCANPRAIYWLHWLALDANVGEGKNLDSGNAQMISRFAPPTPPKAPEGAPPFHRYQILVFAYSGVGEKEVTKDQIHAIAKDRKNFLKSFETLFRDYSLLAQTEFRTKRD